MIRAWTSLHPPDHQGWALKNLRIAFRKSQGVFGKIQDFLLKMQGLFSLLSIARFQIKRHNAR